MEGLEGRLVPTAGSYAWTDGTNDNLASDGANWTNTVTHTTGHVPTSADYVFFGSGNGSANKPCNVNINLSVDRVEMDPTYTATLTVASGKTLSMANEFDQYGTLDLAGNAAVTAQGNVTINGSTVVTVPGMGPAAATLSSAASFYIEPGATITASTSGSGGGGLILSAGSFDEAGTLDAGTATAASHLTVSGNLVEDPTGVINVFPRSVLTINTGGNSSAHADLKGTLSLAGSGTAGAEVMNTQALWIDGGTLTSTGGDSGDGNTISGDVAVYNGGTMTVGSGTAADTLTLTGGSLTVGAQAPGLSDTGGTLTLNTGAALDFPAAAGTSTFVVQGGISPAVLNMHGATITMDTARVDALEVSGGVLNSFDGSIGGTTFIDTIGGNLSADNGGTVNVGTPTAASTLNVTDGSLTVGAESPGDASSAATLNLNAGSTLGVLGAAGGGDTFVAQGSAAVVNMYGATISLVNVPDFDLEGGALNTNSGADFIAGSLTNAGTVHFAGSLHTLGVGTAYTQDAAGTLDIRMANGSGVGPSPSDVLAAGGVADLDGTLTLTGQGSLNAGQTWEPIFYANRVNTFSTVNFPDNVNPSWKLVYGPTNVTVTN